MANLEWGVDQPRPQPARWLNRVLLSAVSSPTFVYQAIRTVDNPEESRLPRNIQSETVPMPIDRTTSSTPFIGVLRALKRKRTETAEAQTTSPSPTLESKGSKHAIDALRQRLDLIVANVDVADERSMKKAREPILKEVLLWEFGEDFRQDPQFLPTLDTLAHLLETQPVYQQKFSELLRYLKH